MTEEIIRSEIFTNAFIGGTVVAIVSGVVGYFLVLRAMAFAGEALTDISFSGATGAVLMGFSPLLGMIGIGVFAVVCLGFLSNRARGRDIEVGMVLSFALGLGVLFLSLYSHTSGKHSNAGLGILFGSMMSIHSGDILVSLVLGAAILAACALIARPLLFSSVDPTVARAKGVPVRLISMIFLFVLALCTAMNVLVMGVLLAVALLIAPAASAANIFHSPARAVFASVACGVFVVWAGLACEFFGPWRGVPVGFFITSIASVLYVVSLLFRRVAPRRESHEHHAHPDRETRE